VLTRHAITRRADDDGVDAAVVERDYVLAHIVAHLHRATPSDGGRLVFKGGTALRLVHIGDYRYSADLDFTIIGGCVNAAIAAVADVMEAARAYAEIPFLELSDGDSPTILYVGPLEAANPRRIKLDLSDSEVVESVARGSILDGVWSDLPDPVSFDVYPLEEIAAEKLRCVIQRVQCRDIYDLYRLVDDMGVSLDEVRPLFERKAEAKSLDPSTFSDRFEDRAVRYRTRWDTEMPEHLADVPRFEDVLRGVRRQLRAAGLIGN
jgi:predicted nucleotidyltransferase component of viral defense system